MRTSIVLMITIMIIAIIGLIFRTNKTHEKVRQIGNIITMFSSPLLIIVLLINSFFPLKSSYNLKNEQKLWERFHLPQIDSSMKLSILDVRYVIYISKSEDSIQHLMKIMDRDFVDIYNIEDFILNKQTKQTLKISFITPNLIRHSKKLITLIDNKDPKKIMIDTLTIDQCDSLIGKWGIFDRIYQRPKVID